MTPGDLIIDAKSLVAMKPAPSNVPCNELEIQIIKLFILPERQERLLFLQARRREAFVAAFHTEKFLNLAAAIPVTPQTGILALMKQRGASNECYVVSAQRHLDARMLPLDAALKECVGFSIETILISPKTGVGYYEGGGYTGRYVLVDPGV